MEKRLLYITNLPAPYKVEFFRQLGKEVDLTVAYERASARNRDTAWGADGLREEYREQYLNGVRFGDEMSWDLSVLPLIRAFCHDVILVNGYSSPTEITAILYMKWKGIPFGLVCDGMLDKAESAPLARLKRFLIGAASFWLSSGKATDQVLVAHGADPKSIYRYPFSSISEADLVRSTYERNAYKKAVGCTSKYMLLYVGQMIPRKGIDILEQAVRGLDLDFQLYMIGGETSIRSRKIVNIGFLKKTKLAPYYKAADLFILPSREDIWGLVVNEAMAYGTPVVATDQCGAALEMIENGRNGAVVRAENAAELTDQIRKILLASDQRMLMEAAMETAREYTIEKMAERIRQVIHQR